MHFEGTRRVPSQSETKKGQPKDALSTDTRAKNPLGGKKIVKERDFIDVPVLKSEI